MRELAPLAHHEGTGGRLGLWYLLKVRNGAGEHREYREYHNSVTFCSSSQLWDGPGLAGLLDLLETMRNISTMS